MREKNRLFINATVKNVIKSIFENKPWSSGHKQSMHFLYCDVNILEDRPQSITDNVNLYQLSQPRYYARL